jgi:hypothetical protein
VCTRETLVALTPQKRLERVCEKIRTFLPINIRHSSPPQTGPAVPSPYEERTGIWFGARARGPHEIEFGIYYKDPLFIPGK